MTNNLSDTMSEVDILKLKTKYRTWLEELEEFADYELDQIVDKAYKHLSQLYALIVLFEENNLNTQRMERNSQKLKEAYNTLVDAQYLFAESFMM